MIILLLLFLKLFFWGLLNKILFYLKAIDTLLYFFSKNQSFASHVKFFFAHLELLSANSTKEYNSAFLLI